MAKDVECCFKSAEEMVVVCIVCVCDGKMLPLNSSSVSSHLLQARSCNDYERNLPCFRQSY